MKKDDLFYGTEYQECLDTDPEDVLRNLFDEDIEFFVFPIKVYVFKRRVINVGGVEKYAKNLLEDLLISLDEEYGSEDYSVPTDNMEKAALTLAKVIIDEYVPWQCEKTGEVIEYQKEDFMKIYNEGLV